MKSLVTLIVCLGIACLSHAQEFRAQGKGYEYGFSEVQGWLGIGQDMENFPQADMVFYAAERKGEEIVIHHPYTDIYMFTNVTTGTADGFWKQLETRYRKSNPNLKVERTDDMRISEGVEARIIYFMNIASEDKAQAIGSIPLQGRIVSLVMQARSEKLLKEHLAEFKELLRTYNALDRQ